MKPRIADVIGFLETIAPRSLAEKWDNVGLMTGNPGQEAKKIWVALDPLPDVVEEAAKNQADLLITHHPLIFKPITCIDPATTTGKILKIALSSNLSIYCAHTNLDKAEQGVNQILADRLGVHSLSPLLPDKETGQVKFVVTVPKTHETPVLEALFAAGAGRIARYSRCSFAIQGMGSFQPDEDSSPFLGEKGSFTRTGEVRIETPVPRSRLKKVIESLASAHPYETPAFDVYPLEDTVGGSGLGLVGTAHAPMPLYDYASYVKERLGLSYIRVAGSDKVLVNRAALIGGSGSGLLSAFFSSAADVFVSGDFRYHDAREAENRGLGLIDATHFGTEKPVVESLCKRLTGFAEKNGYNLTISAWEKESEPFHII